MAGGQPPPPAAHRSQPPPAAPSSAAFKAFLRDSAAYAVDRRKGGGGFGASGCDSRASRARTRPLLRNTPLIRRHVASYTQSVHGRTFWRGGRLAGLIRRRTRQDAKQHKMLFCRLAKHRTLRRLRGDFRSPDANHSLRWLAAVLRPQLRRAAFLQRSSGQLRPKVVKSERSNRARWSKVVKLTMVKSGQIDDGQKWSN